MKVLKLITSLIFALVCFFPSLAFGRVNITSVDYQEMSKNKGKTIIRYTGHLKNEPMLSFKNKVLQLEIPDAVVWPKIEKKISVVGRMDSTLMAYQYNKQLVRFRTILPYQIKGKESKVSVVLKGNHIEVTFPKVASDQLRKTAVPVPNIIKKDEPYDEAYLNQLLAEKKEDEKPTQEKVIEKELTKEAPKLARTKPTKLPKKDAVKTQLSATNKKSDNKFTFAGYIGKFVAFLGLVLLLFYFIVALMKKGILKKGKLGILKNKNTIQVLNSTYIAPKRSLLTVKAQDQILLLGSSESGLTYITELKNPETYIKDGEKEISGSNFDSSFDAFIEDKKTDNNVKLKENPLQELAIATTENIEKKRKPKFKDQIKRKVKDLKPLQ